MSKKADIVVKLLEKVESRPSLPRPLKDGTLLEQGLLVALTRHLPQGEAERVLGVLRKSYSDWNELRVSQAQEIASLIVTGARRASPPQVSKLLPVSHAIREYLQEIFQKNHGFDLEFLREDPAAGAKVFAQMPYLGLAGTCYLLWLAGGGRVPSHPALLRVLERLGVASKTERSKKAGRDVVGELAPEGKELEFVAAFGAVADRWCHATKPVCHECVLVEECAFGRKAFQEWKVAQVRLEATRKKDAARRAILERKESARRAKDDARAAKLAAAAAAKAARERERLEKIAARNRAVEAKAKAKADATAKRIAAEAARKAAVEAKKQAALKKKAQDAERKAAQQRKEAEKKKKLAERKKLAAKKSGGKSRSKSAKRKR